MTLTADPMGSHGASFRIAGIYEPTPDPMRFNVERLEARMHLPDVIALSADPADPQSTEAVDAINVQVAPGARIDAVADEIGRRAFGVAVHPTARPREGDPFAVLDRFHQAIAAVTIVGSTAFLLALMVIRAEERRDLIGMLRLIGVSRRSIVTAILVEGVAIAAVGALVGIALSWVAQFGINAFFQARYDTTLVFVRITPSIALRCLAIALPIGIVTGGAAAWTLVRRAPAALVRR